MQRCFSWGKKIPKRGCSGAGNGYFLFVFNGEAGVLCARRSCASRTACNAALSRIHLRNRLLSLAVLDQPLPHGNERCTGRLRAVSPLSLKLCCFSLVPELKPPPLSQLDPADGSSEAAQRGAAVGFSRAMTHSAIYYCD